MLEMLLYMTGQVEGVEKSVSGKVSAQQRRYIMKGSHCDGAFLKTFIFFPSCSLFFFSSRIIESHFFSIKESICRTCSC